MKKYNTRSAARIAAMSALISVCAWLTVPAPVPFTMQTFGVFCALLMLGGRNGTVCVAVYILLGAVGLPVFSGGGSGIGRLAGVTGGYITGFLFCALTYWGITAAFKDGKHVTVFALAAGLAVCYAFGTAWFYYVYSRTGAISLGAVLVRCVLPYIVPDCAKIALALLICRRIGHIF